MLSSRRDLLWPPFTPRVPERVQDHDGDMFAAIRQKDMLLHHPYETFDMVIRFLEQAARDPNVLAIKQTLYRTSLGQPDRRGAVRGGRGGQVGDGAGRTEGPLRRGREHPPVAAGWNGPGAHVVYGFINYKTHAKISTVVRREGDNLVTYTHYGTGNYHPITARIYTDLSLLHLRPGAGARCDQGVQLPVGLCAARGAGKPRHLARST